MLTAYLEFVLFNLSKNTDVSPKISQPFSREYKCIFTTERTENTELPLYFLRAFCVLSGKGLLYPL